MCGKTASKVGGQYYKRVEMAKATLFLYLMSFRMNLLSIIVGGKQSKFTSLEKLVTKLDSA
jgi:uncharacterized paraquat-inducible protein A